MSDAPCEPTSTIQEFPLECGAILLVEPNRSVRSAAISWWVPAGPAYDPPGEQADGLAVMCAGMLERGAGERDSRSFNDELDRMGVIRDVTLSSTLARVSASTRGAHIADAFELLADLILRPRMPADALEPVRSLCLQAIDGLNDDPSALAGLALSRRAAPAPLNRNSYGTAEVIKSLKLEDIRDAWNVRARPQGSIIAISGDVDAEQVHAQLERLLKDWTGSGPPLRELNDPIGGDEHIEQATAQVHLEIGLAAPRIGDEDEWGFLAAVRALGAGASSRLFETVREKHSLCYDVHAAYAPNKHFGLCAIGSGTTPDRVDETMDCIFSELERLGAGGLEPDEFERVRRGLKTRLMMHGESTSARSYALASDHHQRGHARTLSTLANSIDALTQEEVDNVIEKWMNAAWRADPVRVAVGPKAPFGT